MGDIRKSIVWADWSFNPVFGCLNKCPYCYAKKISYRLASQFSKIYKVHKDVFKAFTPVWLWSNFNKPIPDYVTHVFVNSMSDVAYWEQEWLSRVADLAIQEYPNKKFLFLTKCYRECCENFVFYNEPLNFYYGATVTCAIVTILTIKDHDYIVLLPLEEDGENHDGEVWFYRYFENENDPNEEPALEFIEDDDEYEAVAEAFDEYLDSVEFDEIIEDDEK